MDMTKMILAKFVQLEFSSPDKDFIIFVVLAF